MVYLASGTIEFGEFCLMMKNKFPNARDSDFSEECELREAFKYTFYSFTIRELYNLREHRRFCFCLKNLLKIGRWLIQTVITLSVHKISKLNSASTIKNQLQFAVNWYHLPEYLPRRTFHR